MNRLDDKIAIVTGGTSGMGEASAKRFAEAGAMVVLAGKNRERGEKIEDNIKSMGFQALFLPLDVTNEDSVKEFVETVKRKFQRIDILFNNAGIFPVTPPLENMETENWEQIFDVNSTGVFRVTKYAMPSLIESHGVILNNASIAGMHSFASGRTYAYSASKAATIQFTRMLAKTYGEFVRVNCICPGVIDTPIFENRDFSRYTNAIPMKRVGTPEDVAKVANFLVSDDAAYVNGAVLTIDGGMSV